MKRDMDLIRRIALESEKLPFGMALHGLEDVPASVFGLHVLWMQEAGLVKAFVQEYQSGEAPAAKIVRLTWEGCEFADVARSDTVWAKAKEMVIKPSASFTFGLLRDWLAAEVRDGFPTLRG